MNEINKIRIHFKLLLILLIYSIQQFDILSLLMVKIA